MAGIPEGFIMPTMGSSIGSNVMKVMPAPEAVAGASGTMSAEIRRHKEFNAKRTSELGNLPGEMSDDIELVLIKTDKFTTVPLRASNLTDPKVPFYNELSIQQQIELAELRERFRNNQHGSDTPVAMWDALAVNEQMQLINMGVMYVEQLAAYKEHEYYKLGNGGKELVERAQRHVGAKKPNKQEEFEKNMAVLLEAKSEEKARADAAEKSLYEMQQRLAALEGAEPKRRPGRPPAAAPGVQESTEG